MEGAVQGNQEGKIDKWLIALTLVMETDAVRDGREERGDGEGKRAHLRLRHTQGEK